ncbi:formin-like protein 14 [Portunus trituberculatus]|uniref:formin-like protein 14 n=1 Tax=Portunus trituberculatus TaxID=210409 RepID=UPI001E1CFFF4|nr:formin-like protein 14 [Portunus trituberculatus]
MEDASARGKEEQCDVNEKYLLRRDAGHLTPPPPVLTSWHCLVQTLGNFTSRGSDFSIQHKGNCKKSFGILLAAPFGVYGCTSEHMIETNNTRGSGDGDEEWVGPPRYHIPASPQQPSASPAPHPSITLQQPPASPAPYPSITPSSLQPPQHHIPASPQQPPASPAPHPSITPAAFSLPSTTSQHHPSSLQPPSSTSRASPAQ